MQSAAVKPAAPIVQTSVVRFIQTRLQVTHQDRAICVISGPWGIGKTTAVEAFARANSDCCLIVKIEQGSMTRGASPVFVLQQTIETLRPIIGRSQRASLSNAYWSLRQMLYNCMREWRAYLNEREAPCGSQPLSIIFDEAQYLSRDAIEMLRFWNDEDRTVMPEPVGLMFLGNSEFALRESASAPSVLSGAVRSRALFLETLTYGDVSDEDVSQFLRSKGEYEDEALVLLLRHFKQPRVRRDFRSMDRIDRSIRRQEGSKPISAESVRAFFA